RISGKGERGITGGDPGNLIITFKVKPDEVFHRKNLDIYMTEKINIRQAMFGAGLLLKTIHGKNVRLNIPEGTQSGTKFKMGGRGLESDGRVGDYYVEVNVEIPKKLSEEERQYVEKVADASEMDS
ncbi:MAG: DnaJ C-terminal domain-containing protein, partial [bacterium]